CPTPATQKSPTAEAPAYRHGLRSGAQTGRLSPPPKRSSSSTPRTRKPKSPALAWPRARGPDHREEPGRDCLGPWRPMAMVSSKAEVLKKLRQFSCDTSRWSQFAYWAAVFGQPRKGYPVQL